MAQADKLLVLIGGVDVVLGPLLTLIVYKHGKKTLKFDLTVIALLQLSALMYGLYAVWQSRPVYLVASEQSIELVFANEVDPATLAKAPEEYRHLPAFGPRTVSLGVSASLNSLWKSLTHERTELDPRNYRPYEAIAAKLKSHARPAAQLLTELSAEDRAALTRAMHASGHPAKDLAAVQVRSSRGDAAMLLDTRNGELLRPMAITWPGEPGKN
jgi:hypothetical protein